MNTLHRSRTLIRALALANLLAFLLPGIASSRPLPIRNAGVLAEPSQICRQLLAPILPGRVLADRHLAEEIFADGRGYRVTREAMVVGAMGPRTTLDYTCTFGAFVTTPVRIDLVAHKL